MLESNQAEIISIYGMRGCGKSTLTKRLAEIYKRKIIFDKLEEWHDGIIFGDYQSFSEWWKAHAIDESFTVIIKPEFGIGEDGLINLESEIVRLVYLTGRQTQILTCLIFEEAQFYFPIHQLSAENFELLTSGRHAALALIANTQRPASVNKALVSQSSEVYIGQLFEKRDLEYFSGSLGRGIISEILKVQKYEFLLFRAGEVDLSLVSL